jgi:hypothetical protein
VARSDHARFITGQLLCVDGALSAREPLDQRRGVRQLAVAQHDV